MANYIRYSNSGKIRNKPLDPGLVKALGYIQDMGITAEVFSGGQDGKGRGSRRTGSTRHDHGGAGDMFFYKDGRRLNWANPNDVPVFQEIVRRGRQSGITGFGAGPGYMGEGSMHVGFGSESAWGRGGKSANAPDWLRSAFGGGGTAVAAGAPAPALPAPTNVANRPVSGLTLTGDYNRPQLTDMQVSMMANDPHQGLQGMRPVDIPGDPMTPNVQSPLDVMKAEGPLAGLKALGGTDMGKQGMGILAGAFGGGGEDPTAQAHATPIQSSLPSVEAADAGRMQAAQQLMSTLMAERQRRMGGGRGLSLMG